MERRFEIRKKELVADAEIRPQVYARLLQRLPAFLEPYLACLGRHEQKEHLRTYLQGLLSDAERKNVETIAYLHDQERRELQHFIGGSQWDHKPLLAELVRQVATALGEADGVIVIDPSGFEKDGRDSVGVQRQWLGRLGKIDNGQVGVYLGYASRQGHALCDVRLYLPKEWAGDRARRRKSGVPRRVRFQTRQKLAEAMLLERGPLLPHRWVAGDDEMGRCSRFRTWLRTQGEQYLLAVPSNTNMRDLLSPVKLMKVTNQENMVCARCVASTLTKLDSIVRSVVRTIRRLQPVIIKEAHSTPCREQGEFPAAAGRG